MNRKPLVFLALAGAFLFTSACEGDKKPSEPPADGAKTEPTTKPEAAEAETKPAAATESDTADDEPEADEDSADEGEPSADDFD